MPYNSQIDKFAKEIKQAVYHTLSKTYNWFINEFISSSTGFLFWDYRWDSFSINVKNF